MKLPVDGTRDSRWVATLGPSRTKTVGYKIVGYVKRVSVEPVGPTSSLTMRSATLEFWLHTGWAWGLPTGQAGSRYGRN